VSATLALFVLAAATSLGLAGLAVARRPRGVLRWSFAGGMAGFAAESIAGLVLVTQTDAPDERLLWLKVTEVAGLLLLAPWAVFVASLARPGGPELSRAGRAALVALTSVVTASAAGIASLPAFQIADVVGPFHAARLDIAARVSVLVQLVGTVVLLAGLEAASSTWCWAWAASCSPASTS